MRLADQLLRQINDPTLTRDQQAILRCRLAKELEEAGNYEAARGAVGSFWQRVGEAPVTEGLDARTAAEVLLRAGVLSGWIGSSSKVEGAQETAKNLISESIRIFESLGETGKVLEARTEIAYCYWREGAYDEARVILQKVIAQLAGGDPELKAKAVLRYAIVERSALRYIEALRVMTDAAPLFDEISSHSTKGGYRNELGLVLKNLGAAEKREDYLDRAFVEYAAASYHFEQAGHARYRARVENNLGFLYLTSGRLQEAHEHLDQARRLFAGLKDSVSAAQVDETRARAFLAQERNVEAERVARSASRTLESAGLQGLLAEALTTRGAALARLAHRAEAKAVLERAVETARSVGDNEHAGLAAMTIIEELGEHLTSREMDATFESAGQMLYASTESGILLRIRDCARKVIAARRGRFEEFSAPNFIFASEETAALLRTAHRIAVSDGAVLITGETGTGKEVLAHLIHDWSARPGPFVALNCAVLTDTLIESQLFGHVKGSFTDAVQDHTGAVREAAGGTLFLDEVAELSQANQGKLLRLIEHGEIHTVGAPLPERVDVRIVAATNRDLGERVARRRFRDDLFYRLQTFHLRIPPLRERPEDIPAIAEHFIREITARAGKQIVFTAEAIEAMKMLPLNGNARELRALIERTILVAKDGTVITPEAVETVSLRRTQKASFAFPWEGFSLKEEVRRFEERFIRLALRDAKGMVTVAARLLGLGSHESLNYRLRARNKALQSARKPAEKRKRSIIKRKKK
ncbi:MAG TPA: sigma 54-interacting transcriptional regulator [Pyrinomonadaceae bacterium]|nr:sigma 54-interacting transcriptional regulator [Pyrinomonadaceae bacterium]